MPTNLGHEAISALKVGHESVTAAYAGHQQIFPNTTTIQSASYYPNNNTISCAGGTKTFRIIGDIGATYDLTGSGLTGSYTQTSGTVDYNVTAGNVCGVCDAPSNTYLVTLTQVIQFYREEEQLFLILLLDKVGLQQIIIQHL